MKHSWKVYSLDVWGNAEDGYEVNDRFKIGSVTFDEDATNRAIINALKKAGFIAKGFRVYSHLLDINGDDYFISIDYKGRPEFQLERGG